MKFKKVISIDLDGVLNTYNGNYKTDKIDSIKPGASDFIKRLSNKFRVEIYTVRDKKLVIEWLKENSLLEYVYDITNKKNPKTSVFLDDRAVNFDGNYDKAYEKIIHFSPHWK